MKIASFGLTLLALAIASCSPTLPPPEVAAHGQNAHETEQSHLLLFPVAEAEDLLGRAVHLTKDGAWTIAEARAPGCQVEVKKEKSQFTAKRRIDLQSLTSISVGYNKLISAHAKFGRANSADIDISNTEIYRADTTGPCGDVIVDTVFVGHGKRTLLATADTDVGANAVIGNIAPSAGAEGHSKVLDSLDWSSDQAYGFSYKQVGSAPPLDLGVTIPSIINEGEVVEIKLDTSRPAYLVVYYVDASGKGDVLWPSNEEQAPTAEPGRPAVIPSPKERAQGIVVKASLVKAGVPSRETLVVYAFADKTDFDRLAPRSGGSDDDGAAYAASLSMRISRVPRSRWSRAVMSYVIRPTGANK